VSRYYARKVDTTHGPIRDRARELGASVIDSARLGNDAPDLIIGFRGHTILIECKTPSRADGGVKPSLTTEGQRLARGTWCGDRWAQIASAAELDDLLLNLSWPHG
jgi:hypothetical protein